MCLSQPGAPSNADTHTHTHRSLVLPNKEVLRDKEEVMVLDGWIKSPKLFTLSTRWIFLDYSMRETKEAQTFKSHS